MSRRGNGESLRRFGSEGDSGEQSLISSSASASPLPSQGSAVPFPGTSVLGSREQPGEQVPLSAGPVPAAGGGGSS